MKLNIIVPIFNEDGNIKKLFDSLTNSLKNIKYQIIFVDDGSTDGSYDILKDIYDKNKMLVKVIRFSRNFGKEAAMLAGLNVVNAKYACIIDADLQQDPKYIVDMVKFLDTNPTYDEVAMVNDYAKEKKMQKFLKKSFYGIMKYSTGQDVKTGASDFRVMRENVVKSLLSLGEVSRFSKGLFSWIGFNTFYMNYSANKRGSGKSKFNLKKQLNYAKDGIVSFSTKPLKIATILGTVISVISFIYFLIVLFQTLIFGKDIPGYASLMCVILILGGIQLIVIGIVGEYIANIYMEVKRRPIYITKERLGFDDDIL